MDVELDGIGVALLLCRTAPLPFLPPSVSNGSEQSPFVHPNHLEARVAV